MARNTNAAKKSENITTDTSKVPGLPEGPRVYGPGGNLRVLPDGRERKIHTIDRTEGKTTEDILRDRREAEARAREIITKAVGTVGGAVWDAGSAAKDVRDKNLYQEVNLKSFNEWINQVAGKSAPWVYSAIAVSEALDRETACKLGGAVSMSIARAPENVRADLIKLAQAGASSREVGEAAKTAARADRAAKGIKRSPGRPKGSGKKGQIDKDLENTEPVEDFDAKVDAEDEGKASKPAPTAKPAPTVFTFRLVAKRGKLVGGFSDAGRKIAVEVDTKTANCKVTFG